MPTYQVPPEPDYAEAMPSSGSKRKKKRQPTLFIPVGPELMKEMKMGMAAKVTMKGKVMGMDMHENEKESRHEIRFAVDSVESYSGKEAEVEEVMDDGEEY